MPNNTSQLPTIPGESAAFLSTLFDNLLDVVASDPYTASTHLSKMVEYYVKDHRTDAENAIRTAALFQNCLLAVAHCAAHLEEGQKVFSNIFENEDNA